MTKAKAWAQGILAGGIAAFSTAIVGVLTIPDTFDFTTSHGWGNIARITLIPTALSVFHKLSQSPLPGFTVPLEAGDSAKLQNVAVTSEGITADSATIKKAQE